MKVIKTILVIIIISGIIIPLKTKLYSFTDLKNLVELKNSFLEKGLIESIVITLLVYTVFSLLFITIAPLSIFSGFLFGITTGSLVSYIGTVITMTGSFFWSRCLLKSFFLNITKKSKMLTSIMDKLQKHDKKFILLSRLILLTPYNSLNIICGISTIKFKPYILTSIVGAIPQAFFYGYIGSIFNSLTDITIIKKKALVLSLIVIFFIIIISIIQRLVNKKVA